MIQKIINKIKYKLGIPIMYRSETSKVRRLVIEYCHGKGCDVGFGGDKIKKQDCLGVDYITPYAYTGKDKVDIPCDISKEEINLADNTLDYVYSSHLIEDFEDTSAILKKFIRVLKSGGNLILVFPDQKVYEAHCLRTGQPLNPHHVHKNMGMEFMLERLNEISSVSYEILLSSNCEIDYNVILVLKINKMIK